MILKRALMWATIVGVMLVCSLGGHGHSLPKFMTLPFTDPDVELVQGWFYNFDSNGDGRIDEDDRHEGIDYAKVGQDGTWNSFDVIAVADGQAMYVPGESASWGDYVKTIHISDGSVFYTVNAHLASSPLPANEWVQISQGEKIGEAGDTGGMRYKVVHLHFEVATGWPPRGSRLDPYDIYSTMDAYPPNGACGSDYLWTSCPPLPLSSLFGEYVNALSPQDVLELKPDGTFYAEFLGLGIGDVGRFERVDEEVTFYFQDGTALRGCIQDEAIIVIKGIGVVWVKATGEPPQPGDILGHYNKEGTRDEYLELYDNGTYLIKERGLLEDHYSTHGDWKLDGHTLLLSRMGMTITAAVIGDTIYTTEWFQLVVWNKSQNTD